jgi:hypothetical protein
MKVHVTGVETLEVTDPKGLCEKQAPIGVMPATVGQQQVPIQPYYPTPVPTPTPYTADPRLNYPSIWTRTLGNTAVLRFDPDYNGKWGRGISQTHTAEPKKWEKNWQAKMSPAQEQEAFDHGYTAITQ